MRLTALTLLSLSALAPSAASAADVSGSSLQFTYPVRDAPVWTADGKFDPTVLIKLIEATTDFGDADPQTAMRLHLFPKTGAISITTTVSAHTQIWNLLKQFPALAAAWGPENPDYAKLLDEDAARSKRNRELNQLSNQIERDRLRTLRKNHSPVSLNDPIRGKP
ncbi:hypothetical protein CA13_00680 [Planctomycetes bacterium CA13]|uniref:Uncharacterized protein n=1 Tax=Novipirellula herctigrandis TaxID=2527986 RepID=A0A5C5YUF7_9BACT|nr:hypothetical protein CA13_00680 [Planctomycetes bacterium CA13]